MAASNKSPEVKQPIPSESVVCGATVQLPVFDKDEPSTRFCVAEANFALRKVSDSTTKYYYVLSKLDSATLKKLSTFLKLPRGSDPYGEIKSKLCRAFEPPREQKLDALIAITDAGDERPSEFAMELQRLLSGATAKDRLKRIFLCSLRPAIVTAITSSLSADFDTLAAAADAAWTAATEVSGSSATASVSAVAGAPVQPSSAKRAGCGGRQNSQRSPGQAKTVTLCNYHLKFGDKAKKCTTTCSRWGGTESLP